MSRPSCFLCKARYSCGGGGIFEEGFETEETLVPEDFDFADPALEVVKRGGGEGVGLVTPRLMNGNQARIAEDGEMFANALTRDGIFGGELGRGLGTVRREILDETAAHRVG